MSFKKLSLFRLMDKEDVVWDFPGSPVVKTLSPNGGNMGLIPGWGTKIPHAKIKQLKKKDVV